MATQGLREGTKGRERREEAGKEMFAKDNMGLNPFNVSLAKEGVNGVKGWNWQGLEAYQTQGEKRKLAGVDTFLLWHFHSNSLFIHLQSAYK